MALADHAARGRADVVVDQLGNRSALIGCEQHRAHLGNTPRTHIDSRHKTMARPTPKCGAANLGRSRLSRRLWPSELPPEEPAEKPAQGRIAPPTNTKKGRPKGRPFSI